MALASFDYVRSFCQAAENILHQLVAETPARGKSTFQHGAGITLQEVNVIIGLTGELKGRINFGMSPATAKAIAGAMMFEEVSELDEMAISALCELGNMISGQATILLSQGGAKSDITPPSIVMGSSVFAAWYGIRAMTVALDMSVGTVHLTVGIQPKTTTATRR